MSDFKRYVCSKDKYGEYSLYNKNTGKGQENWTSNNKDKLWEIVKSDIGASRHYRRRNEWIICKDTSTVPVVKSS